MPKITICPTRFLVPSPQSRYVPQTIGERERARYRFVLTMRQIHRPLRVNWPYRVRHAA